MKSVYMASSVQDLASLAEKTLPPIDNNTKLVMYFRAAQQILMQANIYKREGDFEKAYVHMMKYSILILEKLPRHTQYNLPEVFKEKDSAKKMVLKLLDDLEGMKLVLKKLYADEEAQKKKAEEEQAAKEQEKERLRKQEELEREEQEARIRAEQEEQRRKEEEQQREWQMELFARQQLLANNAINDSNTNNNNNNILMPTPLSSGGVPVDGVDPLLGPMMMQLNINNNNNNTTGNLQQPLDGSNSGEQQTLPQDFFLQQQLQQQQLLLQQQQQQQDMLPPPGLAPSSPSTPAADSVTMMMMPPQPSAPPAPPSIMSPPPDFLTPQESPSNRQPPPSPSNQATSASGQPLVDIPQDIYAPPPPETFHNLASLGPTSSAAPEKNDLSDSTSSSKTPVAYPNLYQRDPTPPRNNNSFIPKYTPPPITTLPNNYSPALPATAAYQQHFPPPSPPIQAAQHPLQYAPPPHNFMPHPTYAPPVYSRPPTITTAAIPTQPYKQSPVPFPPTTSSVPSPSRTAQPKTSPAIPPPSPSQRTTIPQGHNPALSSKKDLEVSPKEFCPSAPRNTSGLRKMVVYGEMFAAFMKVANSNTTRQIETCAILSGTLLKDVFYVTTMIVPKQEGTRDTCVTKNEEELFEYQMSKDLLTLGWIHTHPTQDCFMSSVDLHTHCTYQLLLPEAIAVVISPMFTPNFGIFRVSDPPGMQIIQNCNQRGFHQHADTYGKSLYSLCDHVDLVWGSNKFNVVDLR